MNKNTTFSNIAESIGVGASNAIGINTLLAEKLLSDFKILRIMFFIVVVILVGISFIMIFKFDLDKWGHKLRGFFLGFSFGSIVTGSWDFAFIVYYRRFIFYQFVGLSRSIFFITLFSFFERLLNVRLNTRSLKGSA